MTNLIHLLPGPRLHNHVLRLNDMEGLHEITNQRYNLAIVSRTVSDDLKRSVQQLLQSSVPDIDVVIQQPDNGFESITRLVRQCCAAESQILEPLICDMKMCCAWFVKITLARTIRLSLKMIDHDACRKFHIDGYTYRLLCSYAGPGTEWTCNRNVRRRYLGEGENEDIIIDWSKIERLNTFDIAILKGEPPHQPTGKGIVHRSPPVSQTGEKRLLLRIDFTS